MNNYSIKTITMLQFAKQNNTKLALFSKKCTIKLEKSVNRPKYTNQENNNVRR